MKNKIRLVLLLAFLVFISVYYGKNIKQNALNVSNTTIDGFLKFKEYVAFKINEHFSQKEQIKALLDENNELKQYKSLYIAQSAKLNKLLEDKKSTTYEPRVMLSRTLSYLQLDNYNKLFIDYKNIDKNKIYGLIYNGHTIGIAQNYLGKSLAILQGDEHCTFSVFIGNSNAPAIISGNGEILNANFIPKWMDVKVGDKVITSGLDDIFFYGIGVGEVISVSEDEAYKNAKVRPFNAPTPPSFIYVIEKTY